MRALVFARHEARRKDAVMINVEKFARELHESMREAAARGLVANDVGKPFQGWNDLSEAAREGRRVMARYLLSRFEVNTRGPIYGA